MIAAYSQAIPRFVDLHQQLFNVEHRLKLFSVHGNRRYENPIYLIGIARGNMVVLLERFTSYNGDVCPPLHSVPPAGMVDRQEVFEDLVRVVREFNEIVSVIPVRSPYEAIVRNLVYDSMIKSLTTLSEEFKILLTYK